MEYLTKFYWEPTCLSVNQFVITEYSSSDTSTHFEVTNMFLIHCLILGHFTVIEPSNFQNKTMKSSNINALF